MGESSSFELAHLADSLARSAVGSTSVLSRKWARGWTFSWKVVENYSRIVLFGHCKEIGCGHPDESRGECYTAV